jgi:nucleotide-binding universal stress UspA family protein
MAERDEGKRREDQRRLEPGPPRVEGGRPGSTQPEASQQGGASAPSIFARVVCGVDGTPEGLVAVQQAIRLRAPEGNLWLATAANLAKAAHAGIAAPHAAELLQREAEAALAEARELAPSAIERLLNGAPAAVLVREAEATQATLIAVGSHGHRRVAGMLLGTVAARMLRDAPCSVLVARAARDPETWPQSVVVGIDGSAESASAFSAARSLADRFSARLRAVAATNDQHDRGAARAIAAELDEQPGRAVDVLTAASDSADLIIVGSRGLHGLKALGSVSERVAHRAHSSVLVVRHADG